LKILGATAIRPSSLLILLLLTAVSIFSFFKLYVFLKSD
jgi:hypothetical protein